MKYPWNDYSGRTSPLKLIVFVALFGPAAWVALLFFMGWLQPQPFTAAIREIGLCLWEDPDFDRMDLTVGAFHAGRGEKVAGLDVGEALLDEALQSGLVAHRDLDGRPVAGLDRQMVTVDLLDRAADPHRRRGGRGLCQRGHNEKSD